MTPTDEQPQKDLGEIFDLDRKGLTERIVADMEQCMIEADIARDGLKAVVTQAKEAQFRPKDIAAMKRVARLRMADQVQRAREELDALQRVSEACGLTLFDWAERDNG